MIFSMKNKNKGFTLIELLITLIIFSLVVLSMTAIATSIIKSQRKAFALQNIQEAGRYILESMSKEIRMSIIDTPDSGGSSVTFLDITNADGQDVDYRFINQKLRRRVGGGWWQDVSPANLEVTGGFYVRRDPFPNRAVVTIVMKARDTGARTEEQAEIYLQSSIAPRSY